MLLGVDHVDDHCGSEHFWPHLLGDVSIVVAQPRQRNTRALLAFLTVILGFTAIVVARSLWLVHVASDTRDSTLRISTAEFRSELTRRRRRPPGTAKKFEFPNVVHSDVSVDEEQMSSGLPDRKSEPNLYAKGAVIWSEAVVAYSSRERYSDNGSLVVTTIGVNRYKRVRTLEFITAFVRGVSFHMKFELSIDGKKQWNYEIASNSIKTFATWDLESQRTTYKTLGDALIGASGVTRGVSRFIPGLLNKNIDDASWCSTEWLYDEGVSNLKSGIDCIVGANRYGDVVRMDVDSRLHLVRTAELLGYDNDTLIEECITFRIDE